MLLHPHLLGLLQHRRLLRRNQRLCLLAFHPLLQLLKDPDYIHIWLNGHWGDDAILGHSSWRFAGPQRSASQHLSDGESAAGRFDSLGCFLKST